MTTAKTVTMTERMEPTIKADTRIPRSLAEASKAQLPGLSMSAVIRVALARMCGIDSDQFASNLPTGPKIRNQTEAT